MVNTSIRRAICFVASAVCLSWVLQAWSALAAGGQNAPTSKARGTKRTIRDVNFGELEYLSTCSTAYEGTGFDLRMRLKKGDWSKITEAATIYFGIVDNKVVYGDLTGAGNGEAVVHTACGYQGANGGGHEEIYVFTMTRGAPRLLARLIPEEWDRESWGTIYNGIKVAGKQLIVSWYAGGSHARPAWVVTRRLRWNGSTFELVGSERKPFVAN